MSREEDLAAFAKRLTELCNRRGLPKEAAKRQVALGRLIGVSYQATRKWFSAQGFPSADVGMRLAAWGDVSFSWLMTGRESKVEGDTK